MQAWHLDAFKAATAKGRRLAAAAAAADASGSLNLDKLKLESACVRFHFSSPLASGADLAVFFLLPQTQHTCLRRRWSSFGRPPALLQIRDVPPATFHPTCP